MGLFQKKYKLVFLRKHFNAVFVFRVVETNEIKNIVSIEDKKYAVEIINPAYISKNQRIYFFDVDSGKQMAFHEFEAHMKPEELDLIIGQRIIKELCSGVMDNKKEKITMILLGFIMGAMLAAIIAMAYYNGKIQDLMETQTKETVIVANIQSTIWRVVKWLFRTH